MVSIAPCGFPKDYLPSLGVRRQTGSQKEGERVEWQFSRSGVGWQRWPQWEPAIQLSWSASQVGWALLKKSWSLLRSKEPKIRRKDVNHRTEEPLTSWGQAITQARA